MKRGSGPEGYTYYAFISYKHVDEKWAIWLQKQLQSYRLPYYTRKHHPDLPERLTPVFLDRTNLIPGILDDGLRDEVQASKYLIVICSRSANEESRYLDDEIGYYLEGGADPSGIIPFIVDESRQPEKDCFPARLQELCGEKSILGANIHENGRRNALLKVIARMQGIKLEEMESDDRRRRKRTAVRSLLAAGTALIVLTAGAWYCWDYYVPKTAYYADYAERFGVPEGIGRMSGQEAKRSSDHYVIVSSQRKVRELRHEDGYGRLYAPDAYEDRERPAKAFYEYEEDGSLHKVTWHDENDIPVLVMDYVNKNTVDLTQYRESDAYAEAAFMNSHLTSNGEELNQLNEQVKTGTRSSIVRHLVDYDEDGYVREIRYVSNPVLNLSASDADGIGGVRYVRDEKGRAVRLQYLACTGESRSASAAEEYEPVSTRGGIAEIRYQYDDNDDLVSCTSIGPEGRPVRNARNFAAESIDYDSCHNEIRNTYFGEDGMPAESSEGCAVINRTVDERGSIIAETYLNADMEEAQLVYGYSRVERELDENGNVLREAYYNSEGELTPDLNNVAFLTCAYDSEGRMTEMWKYGADGALTTDSSGKAGVCSAYDERGNRIKASYFGTDREPVLNAEQMASFTAEYDDRGLLVLVCCQGTDGQPAVCSHGYAQMALEYDSRGNLSRIRYLDTAGAPMLNAEGIASVEKECDERGFITRLSYYGTDGEAVLSYEGAASLVQEYDDYGNLSAVSCYGTDGTPVLSHLGYARMEMEYDSRARMTEQRIYGTDGEPAENAYGWAAWTCTYDRQGMIEAQSFYAADGTLLLTERSGDDSPDSA